MLISTWHHNKNQEYSTLVWLNQWSQDSEPCAARKHMVFWLHTSTVPLKVYTSFLQVCIVYTLITWVCRATLPWGIHHSDKSASVSQAPTSSLQVYINTRGSSVASSPVIWLSSEILLVCVVIMAPMQCWLQIERTLAMILQYGMVQQQCRPDF